MAGRRIEIQFLGRDVSAGKTADKVQGKFSKFSDKMSRFGPAIAGGLLAGGAAMVKFGNQASDLAETQSKVNQIFGDKGAAALDKFAAGAAKSMGQSKQTALDGAATFGIIGKGAGLAGEDLVGFSTKMSTLASDMASFNTTSPEEAIDAIGAAMRGESEPIRKYGVLLDDATLRNEAMKLGLIKTTKQALTPQQKALAAQSAILKQTKDQQGDFARTSDGVANKTRIMKAQFENLTTQLGQKALPIMSKVTDWALKAIDWMDKHQGLIKGIAMVVVPLVGGLYALAKAQAVLNLVMTANPIMLVVVAIAALVAGLVYAWKHSEKFREIVKTAFWIVGEACKNLWEHVLKPTFKFIVKAFLWVAEKLIKGAAWAFGWVPGIGPKLKAAAEKFKTFKDDVNRQLDGVKPAKIRVDDSQARNKMREFTNFFADMMGKVRRNANVHVGVSGGIGNILGQTTKKASGGHVQAGRAYTVGESGQETFMPYSSGRIVNARRTARMGGTTNIHVHIHGVTDKKGAAREIRAALLDLKRSNGGAVLGIA